MSIYRPGLFLGKTAVVSGGGTGIGQAISKELLTLGANVIIAARNEERLKETCRLLTSTFPGSSPPLGNSIVYKTCNIRKESDVVALMEFAVESFQGVDLLVNNAGGQYPSPASQLSTKGFTTVVDLNLNATFTMMREAYTTGKMSERSGSVVNIVCDMRNGFPLMSHTGAARAAVTNLAMSLAVEWARDGVRVNCVAPGVIWNETANEHYTHATEIPDLLKSAIPGTLSKRLGSVEEVSSAVLYLLSPGAQYVTGETLYVDGGSRLLGPSLPAGVSDYKDAWPTYKGLRDESKL